MKKNLILILAAIAMALNVQAKKPKTISKVDSVALFNAIGLYDEGRYERSLEIFNDLAETYPDNYLINYERLLPLIRLNRNDEAIKVAKRLVKMKDRSPLAFQMYGNLTDLAGKPNEALEIYDKGLKEFPDAGILYLEKGNVFNHYSYFEQALACFNMGIMKDPLFPSNYYRGALAQLGHGNKVWGLIYAETEIMLNLQGEERHAHMAQEIKNTIAQSLVMKNDSIKCTLSPGINMILNDGGSDKNKKKKLDPMGKNVYIGFPGVYNVCLEDAARLMDSDSIPFQPERYDYQSELRRRAADLYFQRTDDLYGSSMYLLQFQKKIIDAGFWDVYDYLIMSPAYDDSDEDLSANINSRRFAEFAEWYKDNIFDLGGKNTVGEYTIYAQFKPMDLVDAIVRISRINGKDPSI